MTGKAEASLRLHDDLYGSKQLLDRKGERSCPFALLLGNSSRCRIMERRGVSEKEGRYRKGLPCPSIIAPILLGQRALEVECHKDSSEDSDRTG